MATVDDKKIIFSMVGLNKTIQQNNKQVLKNIYLSFFYGAKIGIIGLNGSGKSTLLKIIAGLDKSYQGEVVFSPGYSVGYLAQEPYLDPTKTEIRCCLNSLEDKGSTLMNGRKSISTPYFSSISKYGDFSDAGFGCDTNNFLIFNAIEYLTR